MLSLLNKLGKDNKMNYCLFCKVFFSIVRDKLYNTSLMLVFDHFRYDDSRDIIEPKSLSMLEGIEIDTNNLTISAKPGLVADNDYISVADQELIDKHTEPNFVEMLDKYVTYKEFKANDLNKITPMDIYNDLTKCGLNDIEEHYNIDRSLGCYN